MVNAAFINLWDKRMGAIAWDQASGTASFEFDPGFLELGWDPSPLKMPVTSAPGRVFSFAELRNNQTFKGLPGLLADVLPDRYGNTLINTWLAQRGRPPGDMNPVELLCFIGKRGMGALEFEPVEPRSSDLSTKIEISGLVDIAQQILSGRQGFESSLKSDEQKALLDILKIGTSAGGARAKALIAFDPEKGEVRSGQTIAPKGFQHWLIKFDGVHDSQFGSSAGYGRVEMAYYLMALDCGIEMMESRLLEEHDRAHFMTRRFDRPSESEKLHVQSFCAMQHFDFNDINYYSYEILFQTMRQLGLPYPQAEQMYRRMVFNVLARNCDDHTKNFSFVMDKSGQWSIAPAFDVCHAYRPGSTWVSQQSLSVNGKRTHITKNDFIELAKNMNIKRPHSIIDEISAVVLQWPRYAKEQNVSESLAGSINETLIHL